MRPHFYAINRNETGSETLSLVSDFRIHCDFLKNRQQRVKLERECMSEWRNTPAWVPQGKKLGPWLFILMIDDIDTSNPDLRKYVDDTTMAENVVKIKATTIQNDVDEPVEKSKENRFQLN